IRGAYAWRRLKDGGARLAGGSDFPVESENPLHGFFAAVTRQDLAGNPPGGWRPEEKLTRREALALFTSDAAWAAFEADRRGRAAPAAKGTPPAHDREAERRARMVETQIVARGVRDRRVLAAIREVPRHLFVDPAMRDRAYEDHPLPIAGNQTISQPYIVALM